MAAVEGAPESFCLGNVRKILDLKQNPAFAVFNTTIKHLSFQEPFLPWQELADVGTPELGWVCVPWG